MKILAIVNDQPYAAANSSAATVSGAIRGAGEPQRLAVADTDA